jgi:hypothetical protein
MLAGTYNIYCEQGATFGRFMTIEVPDEIDPEITTPYDLTDYTARMQVRRTIDNGTVMAELTTENGLITLGGVLGTIEIQMPAEMTASLSTSGVYDLEIINSGGQVSRVVQGSFTLNQEVTR